MPTVFFSEIHYDNSGTDTGEFIEITGDANTDLTGWSIVLYNGSNGSVYDTVALSGILADLGGGLGTQVIDFPSNGLQNGSPDGFALVDDSGNVVEFLSYEGTLTAVGGAADGMTSTDIGVAETSSTAVGDSLQLIGGVWTGPAANTKGDLNDPVVSAPSVYFSEIHYDNDGTDTGEFIEITGDANTDLTGWSVVLYNGSNGTVYNTIALSGILADQAGGLGTLVLDFPSNGLQNGSPDGFALVDGSGNVVEFLSYEGTLTAVGGPADGMTSTDIGVAESGSTAVGDSLQLVNGVWTGPAVNTKGQVNDGGSSTGTTLSIDDVSQAEGNSGTTAFTFTVTRSGDTTGTTTVDYATSDTTATAGSDYTAAAGTITFAAGETTQTITVDVTGDTTTEADETFSVTLSNASGGAVIADGSGDGTIQNDDISITRIHTIQGSGSASPLVGQTVTVSAIVIGDYQDGTGTNGDLNGFYIQEEDADADADTATSEGLFVFDGNSPSVDVNNGDLVEITGTVSEAFGQTQLSNVTVNVISSGNTMPTAATVNLPEDGGDGLEAFEGMLITIPDELFITEYFNYDRFGEIVVAANDPATNQPGTDGRLDQYTQFNAPDAAGFAAYQEAIAKRTITIDDGLTTQNPSLILPDGTAFSDDNSFRGGDSFTNLTGVLGFGFGEYRIQPVVDQVTNTITHNNPRPEAPEEVGGTLTVSSFNVLNFFTTLDVSGNPGSGPNNLSPRGADSQEEFDRQLQKLTNALLAIDADIFGLVELENEFGGDQNGDGKFAIDTIVASLNASSDSTYAFADPGRGFVDTGDAISNGLIYKTDTVEITYGTTVEVLDDSDLTGLGLGGFGAVFDGENTNRAPIAATFTEKATGGEVTIAVNHFKSKGGTGTGADADQGDGQGNFNQTRVEASIALNQWLNTNPTGTTDDDVLLLGDFNAYKEEDPITVLENAGYTDVLDIAGVDGAYSFVFDGQFGTLDYGFANDSLASQVTGATEWHVNADEPDALDYNLDFGRDPSLFDGSDPYRNSDHDPVIIGLDLGPVNSAPVAMDDSVKVGKRRKVEIDVLANDSDADGDAFAISAINGIEIDAGEKIRLDSGSTVKLKHDGTIKYKAGRGLDRGDEDAFVYEISDGTSTSLATVEIEITGNGRGNRFDRHFDRFEDFLDDLPIVSWFHDKSEWDFDFG